MRTDGSRYKAEYQVCSYPTTFFFILIPPSFRLRLIDLLLEADQPCLRLFLDYQVDNIFNTGD